MYSYLNGIVSDIQPDHITIDVQGVGYQVFTPNSYEFHLHETHKVFLHHYVREDAILLYGFKTKDAKELFVKLLGVKGIGPKSAIAILATGNPNDVIAIEIGNVKFLSKFPGIGPKASQQIILDLKGKLNLEDDHLPFRDNLREVEEALQSLGYNSREIKKAIQKLDGKKPTDQLVKDALAAMLK
jgi:Holliday junction DNA helicase RuvA